MAKHKTKLILGVTLLFAFGLLWLGGGDNRGLNTVGVGGHNRGLAQAGVTADSLAPEFTLESIDGGTISLSDYRGKKPVILDFFATWCPNCRRDMPKLSKWYEQYMDEVEVIGINLQEKNTTVSKYIDSANILFPIVLDPHAQVSRSYGVQYTNFHVLINKNGELVGTVPGDIRESEIISLIGS